MSVKFNQNQLENLRQNVKTRLSEKRFAHTDGVALATLRIAKYFPKLDVSELAAAALLHDVTKELSVSEHSRLAEEQGEPLELETLKIDDFAIKDGWLAIHVAASPATWLNGFVDTLVVRASETLPIPDTDESKLDLSRAEVLLEDGDNATVLVPLGDQSNCRFFKVKSR